MKKFLLLLIGLVLMSFAQAEATYEYTMRVAVENFVDPKNNFLILRDYDEKWLVHFGSGCGTIEEGDSLTLLIRGEMDGNQDELWNGTSAHCIVDVLEEVTGTLRVITTSASDTSTSVNDDGQPYRIYYSERCKALKGLNGWDVYVRKYGSELRAGDKIYMPGTAEACALTHVQREGDPLPEPEPVSGDIKRPTTPTHFRAIPTTSAVYLYWDPAVDNVGIKQYIINVSLYHTADPIAQDPEEKPQSIQGQLIYTQDADTSYRINYLDPDELYFFRIIAMDTSGNLSSYWSSEATAFTKSSIATISLESPELRIFQVQETDTSFLLRWNEIPGASQTVTLEVDNERVFSSGSWWQQYIRIAKKPERKGKDLELIVKTVDVRGQVQKDVIHFSF